MTSATRTGVSAAAARESARLPNGRFGEQGRPDPGQLGLDTSPARFDLGTVEGVAALAAEIRHTSTEAVQARFEAAGRDDRPRIAVDASYRRDEIMEGLGIDPDDPYEEERLARAVGAAIACHAQRESGVSFDEIAAEGAAGVEEKKLLLDRWKDAARAHRELRARVDARTRDNPEVQAAEARVRAAAKVGMVEYEEELGRYRETVEQVDAADPETGPGRELQEQVERLHGEYVDHDGGMCRDKLAALAHAYRQVLGRVRPLGGRLALHDKTSRRAAEAFREAAAWYPTDWVDASNRSCVPLVGKVQKQRAHYRHGHVEETRRRFPWQRITRLGPGAAELHESDPETDLVAWRAGMAVPPGAREPVNPAAGDTYYVAHEYQVHNRYSRGDLPDEPPPGKGWQVWADPRNPGRRYWRRPKTKLQVVESHPAAEITTNADPTPLPGRSDTFAVSVHELAHRVEYTSEGVAQVEQEFLARRTAECALVNLYPGRGGRPEVGRADHFVDAYIGKEYPSDAREVLSCGTQALFGGQLGGLAGAGRYRPDPEHRDLVLGMLATAGNRAAR